MSLVLSLRLTVPSRSLPLQVSGLQQDALARSQPQKRGTGPAAMMEEAVCEVFVSCAAKDREKVSAIKSHIEKASYSTYWDEKVGNSKELLRRESAQSVDGCSIFLCCLSQEYIDSALTMKELRLAKFWGKSIILVKVDALPLDANGNEHLPPKHEIVGLLGKLFPVDLTDPKTHTVKLRDLMSRLEKQLKANCSPGALGSLHEGASRPSVPVADMQPDDVGQVCRRCSKPSCLCVCSLRGVQKLPCAGVRCCIRVVCDRGGGRLVCGGAGAVYELWTDTWGAGGGRSYWPNSLFPRTRLSAS